MRRAFYTSKTRRRSGVVGVKRAGYGTHAEWHAICKRVHARDNNRCRKCGAPEHPVAKGVYHDTHHIIPLSRGGTTTMANLITLCDNCHTGKHPHMQKRT